jgi:hypothetical protein
MPFTYPESRWNTLFGYVTDFIYMERVDGRCGLIYLMAMFTGNTRENNR